MSLEFISVIVNSLLIPLLLEILICENEKKKQVNRTASSSAYWFIIL
jgi:uncharacterized integral membrane protein